MSSDRNGEHTVWEWTDEGGGGEAHLDFIPHWAYPNEDTEFSNDCDCPELPPPPKFALPPPPVPFGGGIHCDSSSSSSSSSDETGVNGNFLSELEYCDMQVLEGPYTQTAIPSIAVIVVCSFLMLVMVLVASLLFWRHKRKMQNFLPCKTSPANHCDLTSGNSVLYEDLTNIRPRNLTNHCTTNQTVAPMELLDVKCSNYGGAGFTSVGNTTFIYPPTTNNENHVIKASKSKDHFNQAYDEVSASSDGKRGLRDSDLESDVDVEEEEEEEEEVGALDGAGRRRRRNLGGSSMSSEGELAEDELSLVDFPKKAYRENGGNGSRESCSGDSSLRGSTGDDLCRDFDSVYSDENETKSTAGSKDAFHGPGEELFSYDGPSSSSSAERKRRRRRKGRGSDSRRDQNGGGDPRAMLEAYPVYCEVPDVNGGQEDVSPCEPDHVSRHPSRFAVRNSNGTLPAPWRMTNADSGDLYDGYRNSDPNKQEMVLVIPTQRRDLPRPPSGLGGGDLGLMSKVGHQSPHPRNNVNYRDQGDELRDTVRRIPSDDYSKQTWGPNQRNSDPHERTLAEFSTFQPKKGMVAPMPARDLYGLDVGMLNNDLGGGVGVGSGPYAHLPAGHRNSGSDGSRGSSSSVERLLPPTEGSYYPYHHHHHHHQQQHHHPQQPHSHPLHHPHFLSEVSPASPGGGGGGGGGGGAGSVHRVAFPSNQRNNNRRRTGDKSSTAGYSGDLDPAYGARTVYT